MLSLESALSLGVTGKIDLIELIATIMLTAAGADKINKARARLAAGDKVNATIEGYLELSATGSLQHNLTGGGGLRIPASGESRDTDDNGVTSDFKGMLQILGRAEIKLHVEGSVFMIRAQAGVRGSIHTSWTWEARNSADGKREKRYKFEGVKLSGEAYAEITMGRDKSDEVLHGRIEGDSELVDSEERSETLGSVEVDESGDDSDGKTIWPREEGSWVAF